MTREQALKRLEAIRTHGRNAFGYGSRGLYQAGAEDLFRELDAAGAFEREAGPVHPRCDLVFAIEAWNAYKATPADVRALTAAGYLVARVSVVTSAGREAGLK